MPATLSVTSQFTYDKRACRYRRAGRFVSDRAVKLGVRRVIRTAGNEIARLGADVAAGRIPVAQWQRQMAAELKSLHVAAAIAGRGGLAQMTRADYLRVGRELKSQYAYLRKFAGEVAAGTLSPARVESRAKSYAAGMSKTYEATRRAAAIAAGFDQERNVLGVREHHCTGRQRPGCLAQTAAGWARIGSLVPIGSRQCLTGCGCYWRFRRLAKPPPAQSVEPVNS